MGYKILRANTMLGLEARVNSSIEMGWEPLGMMGIDETNPNRYFQTLVKKPIEKIEYGVIETQSTLALIDRVEGAIKDGWTPSGGVAITLWEDGQYENQKYCQAMIRTIQEEAR